MKRALYGRVRMNRDYCKSCCSYALIIDNRFGCCGKRTFDEPTAIERMCETTFKRRRPTPQLKKELLEKFEDACAYCRRLFSKEVKLHWDHFEPYVYDSNNSANNFLPACARCNITKKDLMFNSLEEARIYILSKIS